MGMGMNACMGIAQSQFSAFHERFRLLLRDHAIKAEPSQLISNIKSVVKPKILRIFGLDQQEEEADVLRLGISPTIQMQWLCDVNVIVRLRRGLGLGSAHYQLPTAAARGGVRQIWGAPPHKTITFPIETWTLRDLGVRFGEFCVYKSFASTQIGQISTIPSQIMPKPATSPSTLNDEAGGWRTLILREEYKFALTGCH